MKKVLDTIKNVLTSEYFVVGVAGLAGLVIYLKGLHFIGGIAIGVAGAKMWDVLRKSL
tara:strand:- start:1622 stop:1795 length:174 start_codon:yes stop_codon:yes gene_type:complete